MPFYQNVVTSLERLEGIKNLFDWSLVCHVASPTFPSSHARKFFVSTYENSVFSFILFLTKNICTYDCWVVFNFYLRETKFVLGNIIFINGRFYQLCPWKMKYFAPILYLCHLYKPRPPALNTRVSTDT